MLEYTELSFCVAFATFNKLAHPLVSLFTHYDPKTPRMLRFTLVLGQLSIVTILTLIFYSKTGRDIFGEDPNSWFYVAAIILGLCTLPLPKSFFKCFDRQVYSAEIAKKPKN